MHRELGNGNVVNELGLGNVALHLDVALWKVDSHWLCTSTGLCIELSLRSYSPHLVVKPGVGLEIHKLNKQGDIGAGVSDACSHRHSQLE